MPKWLLISIICALIVVGGFIGFNLIKSQKENKSSNPLVNTTEVPSSTTQVNKFAGWSLFRNGYGIMLPPKWKNTSDTGGSAVFEPGDKVGNITKMSVTVLSDAKAKPGQQFTSQKEFDEWVAVDGEVSGRFQKINNVLVDGQKGIMLSDKSAKEDRWNIITWVRKDNINVYINANGDAKYDLTDTEAVDYLVSSFRFSAPASTGDDKDK